MESWKRVWREGFCPSLSTNSLKELAKALETDDGRLLQGATTTPPPLKCVQDWPVEAACAIAFCGMIDCSGDPATVAEVEEFFARACYECDGRLGEPAGCCHYLDWYDDTPRDEMRKALLPEVLLEIERRNDKTENDYDIGGEA